MRRLGVAPSLLALAREDRTVNDWFTTITERMNMSSGSANPTVAEVPENQWILYKNTTLNEISIWVNDAGTMRQVGGSAEERSFSALLDFAGAFASPSSTNKVPFAVTLFDRGSCFDGTNNRYVADTAGRYFFEATVGIDPAASYDIGSYIALYKNGLLYAYGDMVNENTYSVNVNCVMDMSVNDYVEVYVHYVNAAFGAVLQPDETIHFSGFLLPTGGGGSSTGPAFRAYQSVGQAVPGGAATVVNFQTIVFDTDGAYNTANSRFTPHVEGYYQFTAGAAVSSQYTANTVIGIYKNGVVEIDGVQTDSSTYRVTVTGLVYMNGSTDYVEAQAFITPARTLVTGQHQTYFMGHLARAA